MSQYRLNLTIDKEFESIIKYFKQKSPLLSDSDVIRMVVGNYFVLEKAGFDSKVEYFSDEDSVGIKASKKELAQGKGTTWNKEEFLREMMK
jgi:hypothetical protein